MKIKKQTSFPFLKITIYRYEIILFILILILTGNISIISKGSEINFKQEALYPFSVALTFDDGPYTEYTEKLLDILNKNNVPATFFLIGSHIKEHPQLLNLILSKGHEIGNHTYTHKNITKLSYKQILDELEDTKKIIKEISGKDIYLFRPPGGNINNQIKNFIESTGYKNVMWTVLPKDHISSITEQDIINEVIHNTKDKGIILLHQGIQTTMNVLPEIIYHLRTKGYKFVTVSNLENYYETVRN